ncbi:protein O-glucosyltransferase 2-like [Artemia franciscana]|uniref:protein O-glucosyltransferase 2-like n=1 Tax=Artemia franciscana TaxID=6661 RepID=UPI0032DB6DBF
MNLYSLFLLSQTYRLSFGFDVFGPGINANIVLPVRYFFVNLTDTNVESLVVNISGKDAANKNLPCRAWTQVLNRKDGIYIVRYKLYNTCIDVAIHLQADGKPLALHQPWSPSGTLLCDDCNCPNESLEAWLKDLACPAHFDQVKNDLKLFQAVDMDLVLNEATKRFNVPGAYSFCNYVVKDNEVYRKCYGKHVGFNIFMDAILLSLLRKVRLPDMELIVNLGDWPLVKPQFKPIIPVFSWCGSNDTVDIVMPTYDITQSTLEMMSRVTLDMLSVQGNSELQWDQKYNKSFWRGRDSRRERLNLIDLAKKHPDLIDAKITNFFFFRDEMEEYGGSSSSISFFKFFQYKYQINIDGTVAAYRFPYLLAGDSVILKQNSKYYEHFYKSLKPWKHYIPMKEDLSDLIEKIEWAKNHDLEARRMGEAGRRFANENLLPRDIFCYHAVLFKEWTKRFKSTVTVRSGMEHVEQPKKEVFCPCKKIDSVKTEL